MKISACIFGGWTDGSSVYVKVEKGPGLSLIYIDDSGNRHVKKGGDKNWRCNNPGNLKESI